jgi:predicted anti-sigma-YlaC factor YlaD
MLTPLPPNDCTRAREAASTLLDAELSQLEAAHLDLHLDACADCRAYTAELAGVGALLRAAPLVQPSRPLFVAGRRRPPFVTVRVAAAAAVVVAATGASFAVGQRLGSHGSVPSATIGSTLTLANRAQPEVVGMLRRLRPARMPLAKVIPV